MADTSTVELSSSHKSTPRDLFLHLFSLIALITCISSFTAVVFQLLNLQFPISELDTMNRSGIVSSLRTSLSIVIVFFPSYMWSVWYIEKMYRMYPARATIGIRKWLIYFILFAVSLTILTNVVVTLNVLLNGETTIRFLLKALTVLVVSLAVGSYYLSNLRRYATR